MSITGGTDGSLFGGTGNDTFNFIGGKVSGVVDTGTGADSVVLSNTVTTPSLLLVLSLIQLFRLKQVTTNSCPIQRFCWSISLDAGADTINFTASSVSLLATTIKGDSGATVSAFTERMMLSSTSLLVTPSSVELVQTPSSSLAQLLTTRFRQAVEATAL